MGHTFCVMVQKPADSISLHLQHAKAPKKFHDSQVTPLGIKVTATEAVVIPPQTVTSVPISVAFPKDATCLLVERMEHRNRAQESFFGAPCSLIQKDNPFLQVANFTDHLATIQKGCILGWAQDAASYLDSEHNKSEEEVTCLHAHASAICTIVSDLLDQSNPAQSGQEEEEEGEAERGCKTAEVPDPDPISTLDLLSQVNFSPDLTPEQCKKLVEVVLNQEQQSL